MYIVLLGAPGSGKGTVGEKISKQLTLPTISTGDILRENIKNQTKLGQVVASIMEKGELVSDDIVVSLVKNRLEEADCQNGCIFDGFPRTVNQAKLLNKIINIDKAVLIDVEKDVITNRILSRKTCPKCSKTYSMTIYKQDTCLLCGEKLVKRQDDTIETIEKRYETYEQQTKPVIEFYKSINKLIAINGDDTPDGVYNKVLNAINTEN